MLGFFTQMHLVIAIQPSQPSTGAMSRRRRGNMVIVFERLRRLLLPLNHCDHWGMGKEAIVFIIDLLTCCPARAIWCIVLLWPGWDVATLSFSFYGLLQCAFVGAGPSLINLLMPLQRWAWLKVPGTSDFDCTIIFKQLSSTQLFSARGGGKGIPSSPG